MNLITHFQARRRAPRPWCRLAVGNCVVALLGISTLGLSAGEGYLSRVGPPPMRLSSPAPPLVQPRTSSNPSRPSTNGTESAAATTSNPPTRVTTNDKDKTEPSEPALSAKGSPASDEFYGPPPPPAPGATTAGIPEPKPAPTVSPVPEPTGTSSETIKADQAPIVEFRAASESVGIRSFDPSGRVGITPQMLVRFFKRRPEHGSAVNPGTTTSDAGPEAMTEIFLPVEFIPPQPLMAPPSSSATYQLVPKP